MKQGEIDYLRNAGEAYAVGAFDKPFSEQQCAKNLVGLGLLLSLLPGPSSRVLDLGCGTGWTSWFMAKNGHHVVGQDIAPDMIDLANRNRDRFQAHTASFVLSDYESLPFCDEFDAAVFYDSLHHAENPQAAIDCAFRALRPGGVLITHEPGVGHSTHPASIAAMQKWGVSEKDMPPSLIFALGRRSGFRQCRRVVDPTAVFRLFYRVNLDTQAAEHGFRAQARSVVGVLRRLFDARHGAICILTK